MLQRMMAKLFWSWSVLLAATFAMASPTLSQDEKLTIESKWSAQFQANEALPQMFRQIAIKRGDNSLITVFLGNFDGTLTERKPLLIFLAGSGAQSHFSKLDDGRVAYATFGLIAKNFGDQYHVVCTEKRGVPFGSSEHRGTGIGASPEYNRYATLENRVRDTRLLLDTLLREPCVDATQVLLLGHSEGADVAAATAAVDDRVTHVAFLSGGGAPQFFDFFVQTRRRMKAEGASPQEIEKAIQDLQEEIGEILDDPNNDSKFFAGHAYRRWSSFATVSAADNLMHTNAKLFLAHGTADRAVPIESFDLLVVKLLCGGRTDTVIRRYPGRDHSFIQEGEEPSSKPFLDVVQECIKWANAN